MGLAGSCSSGIGYYVYDWRNFVMIYTKQYRHYNDGCDGQWHCPFTPAWVEMMKQAAKHCESLSPEYIERTLTNAVYHYRILPGDFLSEPQDPRGLPLSWCEREKRNYGHRPDCCTAIYDYSSIPDIVVTNGHKDWPYDSHNKVLTA